MLIYLHGFNSSPASSKASLLRQKLESMGRGAEFAAPALPHRPSAAIELLKAEVARHPGAALVGSSLGGFYASWLSEKHALRAVLVNPAVRPHELLRSLLGVQQNLHTGERYEFTAEHLEEIAALEVARVTPERYLLMVRTGDELLDYREAVAKYRGCRQLVLEGGDHAFSDFEKYLDVVLEFCG
ncbi:MAG: esterase, partial [Betaproteobacteria bacterium]|nr:esterase [Betaproteobacteria bacterium]